MTQFIVPSQSNFIILMFDSKKLLLARVVLCVSIGRTYNFFLSLIPLPTKKISYPIHEGPTYVLFLCTSLVQNFEKLCHLGLLFMFIFTSLCGNNLASRHMVHTCSFNYKHPYIVKINIFSLLP